MSASASASGRGKRCVRPGRAAGPSGSPKRAASRPASVLAPRTVTCWPSTARTATSKGSQAPGTRSPGRRASEAASLGSRASWAAIGSGSASRSKRRRTRDTIWWTPSKPGSRTESRSWLVPAAGRTSSVPSPAPRRTVRRYASPSTCSTPCVARAARKSSSARQSSGARNASRSESAGSAATPGRRLRSAEGGAPKLARIEWLNWRTLAKPAAKAISASGRSLSSSRRRARWVRRARAMAPGATPMCVVKSRPRWRAPMPSRAAKASRSSSSRAPAEISRSARATSAGLPTQAGVPGAVSGRQRRQARKPAASAAAAHAKKRTFSRRGVRAGQIGRQ